MNAKIDFTDEKFTACLLDGTCLSGSTAADLAKLLLQAGVSPDGVSWQEWALENKFRDIMRATENNNTSWAKMAECELHIRMGHRS
jgi:hypothetical protein